MPRLDLTKRLASLEAVEQSAVPVFVWLDTAEDRERKIAEVQAANPGRKVMAFSWLPTQEARHAPVGGSG